MSRTLAPPPAVRWTGISLIILANALHLRAYAAGSDAPWQLGVFLVSLAVLPWLCWSHGAEAPPAVASTPPTAGDGPAGLPLAPPSAGWPAWAPPWRLEALLAALVLGVGFFLRVWRIDEVPAGIWADELLAAANGVRVLEGIKAPPFGTLPLVAEWPQWVHTFNLYTYTVVASLKLFGVGFAGIKALSIVPGCLTLVGFYVLLRELGGPRLALLGVGAMTLSRWHLTQSRFEWDATFAVMGAVWGFAAMVRGLRTGRHHWMALGGIALGLVQFSYLASRLSAAAAAGWLAALFLLGQHAVPGFRRRVFIGGLVWSLAFSAAAGPVVVFTFTHEEIAEARIKQLTLDPEENPSAKDVKLTDNIQMYLRMFRHEGPDNARQNIPGAPMLPAPTSALMAVGAALCVMWRRGIGASLSWAVFVGALAGGILSDNHGAPNAHRVGLVLMSVYLWVALGLEAVAALLGRAVAWGMERRASLQGLGRVGISAAVLLAVVWPGSGEAVTYFTSFGGSKAHWRAVRAAEQLHLGRELLAHRDTHDLWVDVLFDDLTLDLLLWTPPVKEGKKTRGGLADPAFLLTPLCANRLPAPAEDGRPVLVALAPESVEGWRRRWPELPLSVRKDPFGQEMYALVMLSPDDVERMRDAVGPQIAARQGDLYFTREDLKGHGLLRLVAGRRPRDPGCAYVDRPQTFKMQPRTGLPRESVAMEWHGWLQVDTAGEYQLREGDRPVRGQLWVDGQRQMYRGGVAKITLEPGRHALLYKAHLSVYGRLTLEWKAPGGAWAPIPSKALSPRLPKGFERAAP